MKRTKQVKRKREKTISLGVLDTPWSIRDPNARFKETGSFRPIYVDDVSGVQKFYVGNGEPALMLARTVVAAVNKAHGPEPVSIYSTISQTRAAELGLRPDLDYYLQIAKASGVKRQDVKRVLMAANYTPPPAKIHHDEEWATADGRRIKVCDMDESHVRNALRMTIRRDRKRALDRISRIVRSLPMPVDRLRTHVVDRGAVEALAGDLALDYGDSQGDQ